MGEKYAILHTQHYEPLWLFDSIFVWLGISQDLPIGILGFFDFLRRAVADENWFSSPFYNDLVDFVSF